MVWPGNLEVIPSHLSLPNSNGLKQVIFRVFDDFL